MISKWLALKMSKNLSLPTFKFQASLSKENTVSFHPFLDESFAALLPNPQPAVLFLLPLCSSFQMTIINLSVHPEQFTGETYSFFCSLRKDSIVRVVSFFVYQFDIPLRQG